MSQQGAALQSYNNELVKCKCYLEKYGIRFKLTLQNRVGGVKLLQQLHNQPGYKIGILTKDGKTVKFT